MKIQKEPFGKMPDGRAVYEYTITNDHGALVSLITLGGAVRKLIVPDRTGAMKDVVCGFDRVDDYLTTTGYQGALIGRVCNRIGNASFSLDGKNYSLFINSGKNDSLHGGKEGFNRKLWLPVAFEDEQGAGVRFYYVSKNGEEGYPGQLNVVVTYTFTDDNRLIINYKAETDKPTPVNLTNHAYFNLSGYDGGSVMEEELYIDADAYLPTDENLIPLPEAPLPVENTAFDYTQLHKIVEPMDHNFIFRDFNGMIKRRAFLVDRSTGVSLTVYTDMPAMQVYTGCVMNGPEKYKNGVRQVPLHAICLETSYPNDSPNRPDFIPCILRPGELYDSTTVYEFGTV